MRLSSVFGPPRHVVEQQGDPKRGIVRAGRPVIRQNSTPPAPARAFLIGLLIGLVLLGLVFAII